MRLFSLLLTAFAAVSCVGEIGDPGLPAPGAPGGRSPEAGPGPAPPAGPVSPDPRPSDPGPMGATVLHRLNRVELANTLADLFGPSTVASLPPGSDPVVQSFDSNAEVLTTSQSAVEAFLSLADALAQKIPLTTLAACVPSAPERTCASMRVAELAPRILRRPATPAELQSYLALWDDVRGRETADAATRAVIERLLLTPDFLYHVEVGDGTGRLSDHELGARLSFMIWESAPDQALSHAAAGGKLKTRPGVEAELARLLSDPKGSRTVRRFFEQWAELDKLGGAQKDPAVYPQFESLKGGMQEEFRRFIGDLLARDGTVKELLTSSRTFADEKLAALYGVASPGPGFQPVQLDVAQRAGVLTQAAFLALHGKANKSAPILRGVFVRERVLCSPVPPPPPSANNIPASAPVATTTREFFRTLTAPEACAGCHALINPIGFAFEAFDGQGRARTTENGHPVDTTGALTAGDQEGPVSGAVELAQRLGDSKDVRTCLATNWFRSRFRRSEVGGDAKVIEALARALESNGDRIWALATALASVEALYQLHYRENRP